MSKKTKKYYFLQTVINGSTQDIGFFKSLKETLSVLEKWNKKRKEKCTEFIVQITDKPSY